MMDSEPADSVSNSTNGANSTPVVTVFIGIGMAILIALTAIAIVVITLVLLYSRKSSQPKPNLTTMIHTQHYAEERLNSYSQTHSNLLYIQMSPSTGQSEMVSTEKINIPSSQQTSVSSNTDTDQGNKISEQDDVSTSEQPTYAAIKKKTERKEFPEKCIFIREK